jgi:predicted nuclease of predicted toxin-antitoxin system
MTMRCWKAAVEHERILVTADTDFGTLLARSGAPLPSVVLLRRSGRRPAERTQQIVVALELAEDALTAGALVVSEATRLRVRPLPVEQTTDE